MWETDDPELPRFTFPGREDSLAPPLGIQEPRLHVEAPSRAVFQRAFAAVQGGLQRGDSFLTNLTFPIAVRLRGTPEGVYHLAEAKYRIWWPGHFVCFSPETFVTIDESGYIETRPMKGTAHDTPASRRALLDSTKEIAEHATIVDLLRNDLSRVASRVRVTDYRYFHKIATSRRGLVQTSSNIGGRLPTDWKDRLGDLLTTLLPAGSISGAPKPATLKLIREAETGPRGYYCGVAGYFDGTRLDTCVMIRFIEQRSAGRYVFRSGGGITARSNWEDEYRELLAKVRIPVAD